MPDSCSAVFAPSSVAVIGASDNPNKVGGRPIHYMTRFGYTGAIYPVNPARSEIQNRRCYPSLQAIGSVPDAAIVAVAGKDAIQAVRDSADLGVALVVVMASGFAETGVEGRQRQEEMVAYAAARGTRVIGPNAQGVANFANGAVLNFSTMFMEVAPQDGPIAIISQSGAASVMPGKQPYGAGIPRSTSKAAQRKLRYTPARHYRRDLPAWVDETLRCAVHLEPHKRHEDLPEFIYDLHHPNKAFLSRTRPPLIERNPVVFWKGVSFVLMVLLILLVMKASFR
jgi:predicted CoA-binding protein